MALGRGGDDDTARVLDTNQAGVLRSARVLRVDRCPALGTDTVATAAPAHPALASAAECVAARHLMSAAASRAYDGPELVLLAVASQDADAAVRPVPLRAGERHEVHRRAAFEFERVACLAHRLHLTHDLAGLV